MGKLKMCLKISKRVYNYTCDTGPCVRERVAKRRSCDSMALVSGTAGLALVDWLWVTGSDTGLGRQSDWARQGTGTEIYIVSPSVQVTLHSGQSLAEKIPHLLIFSSSFPF